MAVFVLVLSGILLSAGAFGLGWIQRAPYTIGRWVRGASVLGLIWAVTVLWITVLPADVTVRPAKATFASANVQENYAFTVSNRIDDDVYSVVVKLAIITEGVTADDFTVEVPRSSRRPLMDDSMASDVAVLRCIDSNGRQALIPVFVHLRPKEQREVSLTRDKAVTATIAAEILHFVADPQSRVRDQATFVLGEEMKCGGGDFFRPGTGPGTERTPEN